MLFNNVFPGVPENLVEDAKKVDSWKRYAKYQGLSLTNKPLFDEINRYAVTFQKFFDIAHLTSLIHNPQATQIIEQIPKTRIEYCFEQCEKLSFLLAYPVKVMTNLRDLYNFMNRLSFSCQLRTGNKHSLCIRNFWILSKRLDLSTTSSTPD